MTILELINDRYDNRYSFLRVNKVEIDTADGRCEVILLYPYEKEKEFTQDDRAEITKWVKHMLPDKLNVEVAFKKSYVDESVLERCIFDFFKKKLPIVGGQISKSDVKTAVTEEFLSVEIAVGPKFYEYVEKEERLHETLKNYLDHQFSKEARIKLVRKEEDGEFNFDVGEERMVEFRQRLIDFKERERGNIIGKGISGQAMFISDVKAPSVDVTLCGRIESFTRRIAKSGYIYYTFVINDTTGRINAKYFTRSKDRGALDGLTDGEEIVVQGNVDNDSFIKDIAVMVRRLSLARIDFEGIVVEKEKNVIHDKYQRVSPRNYVDVEQQNMFTNSEKPSQYVMGRDFVVFDFETTGLDTRSDTPIELAAVKVRDGVIIETFSTFVNPMRTIPEKVKELTSIDDDMVKDAPKWGEVVADFYKFTRGATLVAHNISYDYAILQNRSEEFGYDFDNELVDTLRLCAENLHAHNNKLETVCKHVGITLDGAHRAINDTIATAKLFLYLAKRYL